MNKAFYYTGKTHQNATYKEKYIRLGRWKKITYNASGEPYFIHAGRRYYLKDFLRSCSPWTGDMAGAVTAADGEHVTLAGYEADQYYKPLFIELDDGGEACRVYRYEGSETDYT